MLGYKFTMENLTHVFGKFKIILNVIQYIPDARHTCGRDTDTEPTLLSLATLDIIVVAQRSSATTPQLHQPRVGVGRNEKRYTDLREVNFQR
jgi:hypothetical protein